MCIFPNSQFRFTEVYFLKVTGQRKFYNYRQKAGLINSRCKHKAFWGHKASYMHQIVFKTEGQQRVTYRMKDQFSSLKVYGSFNLPLGKE